MCSDGFGLAVIEQANGVGMQIISTETCQFRHLHNLPVELVNYVAGSPVEVATGRNGGVCHEFLAAT
jgi:hypothetical protein